MAVLREQPGLGPLSGRLANLAFAQTKHGTVMRARPQGRRGRSPRQAENDARLRLVNAAWDALSSEDVAAWRRYASGAGGDAYRTFVGLSTKRLQVDGAAPLPSRPPEGVFFGDALAVTVGSGSPSSEGSFGRGSWGERLPEPPSPAPSSKTSHLEEGVLTFFPAGANRPGMLTELLGQWVAGPHNAPRPKSYASLGFTPFEGAAPVAVVVPRAGTWVCAVRFVEAATGRMTDLVEIDRARVAA